MVAGALYRPGDPCLVAISSDGKTLVAGTGDGCLKVWDIDQPLSSKGAQTVPFGAQEESLHGLEFRLQPEVMWSPYREGWLVGSDSEWLLWVSEEFQDAVRAHTPKA